MVDEKKEEEITVDETIGGPVIGINIDTEEKYEWLMKLLGLPVVKPKKPNESS